MSCTFRCLPSSPPHSPVAHNCRSAPTSMPFSESNLETLCTDCVPTYDFALHLAPPNSRNHPAHGGFTMPLSALASVLRAERQPPALRVRHASYCEACSTLSLYGQPWTLISVLADVSHSSVPSVLGRRLASRDPISFTLRSTWYDTPPGTKRRTRYRRPPSGSLPPRRIEDTRTAHSVSPRPASIC